VKPKGDGDVVVYSHAGDSGALEYVREKLGLGVVRALRTEKAVYTYHDEGGHAVLEVVRMEPKGFFQRRPGGGKPNKWTLYRLTELLEAVANYQSVFIAEGEKAVDALTRIGVVATCSPMGAGKWRDEYSQHLKGANVIILPDNDEPGRAHAEQVTKSLTGIAASVRTIALPDLPRAGDPYDWVQSGGKADALWELVETSAPEQEAAKPLTLAEWLERDIPEADYLLGSLLSTSTRAMLVAPTGLGKTNLGLAIAFAVAEGSALMHWRAGRKARVLFVDGEMSQRGLRRTLRNTVKRARATPDGLMILSKADFEDMPPLNTPQGQAWIDTFITKHGPFDLIIFDNIQALLVGSMKEEEGWADILPWVRSLTRRSIGQMWVHHTGHDESKSYGSKAREWQLDTVMMLERIPNAEDMLTFTLKFTKARERTPENKDDFETGTITLVNDVWTFTPGVRQNKGLGTNQRLMYGILKDAMPGGLTLEEWNKRAEAEGLEVKTRRSEAKRDLQDRKLVHECQGTWYVTK
jgi:hypothetical protein